ncbi:uncharacterized protein LOC132045197 [Lycium ferocissimum]|uniref:uncharacterized protein LOC132045197 n=1 Tax=Lycium ferocissimum TaxID=112874 RepID=UPI0028151AA9|nr:uncharacterized protein LOC132045197 [Lycium ferocissimum]
MNEWKRPREVHPKVFAAIYSSNYDSWKHIETNFAYENRLCDYLHCTHLNGVYYWLCFTKDDVYIISTFDFAIELFGEIVGPPIPNDHSGWLMLRGGSLAAMSCNEIEICETTGSASYDIWASIRENSWIKVVTVTPPITWHSPLGIWEYDMYIYEMMQTYNLVYYDHTTKQVTDFGLNFSEIGFGFVWPISYKESLVPINRKNLTEQDNIDYFFTLF